MFPAHFFPPLFRIEGYRSRRSLKHISNATAQRQHQWQSSLPPVAAMGMSASCPQLQRPAPPFTAPLASPMLHQATSYTAAPNQLPQPFASSQSTDSHQPFSVDVILNAMSDDGRGYISSTMSMPLLKHISQQPHYHQARSSLQMPLSFYMHQQQQGALLNPQAMAPRSASQEPGDIIRFGIMPLDGTAGSALVPTQQIMARK